MRKVGQCHTQADDVGFLLAFELLESHLGGFKSVTVEYHLEGFAFGLFEGDELPPVDIGCVVDQLNHIAEEVEIALGTKGEGAALGRLVAHLENEVGAVLVELMLHLVEEELALGRVQVVHHGQFLAVRDKPIPKLFG